MFLSECEPLTNKTIHKVIDQTEPGHKATVNNSVFATQNNNTIVYSIDGPAKRTELSCCC